MKPNKKIIIIKRVIYGVIFTTLVATLAFIIVKMIISPAQVNPETPYEKVKTDYIFILVMSIFGVTGTLVPVFFDRKLNYKMPTGLEIMFILFLFGSVYLGEVQNFYYRISFWDDILHAMSGAMFAIIAFSVIGQLNKKHLVDLNPLFISIFSFCFAVTFGAIWEIIEFLADSLAGVNMQKWATQDGTALIGRAALVDTMIDLIIDSLGALVISVIGYLSLKGKKEIINSFLIINKKDKLKEIQEEIKRKNN